MTESFLPENVRQDIINRVVDVLTVSDVPLKLKQIQCKLRKDFNTCVSLEELNTTIHFIRYQTHDERVRLAMDRRRIRYSYHPEDCLWKIGPE